MVTNRVINSILFADHHILYKQIYTCTHIFINILSKYNSYKELQKLHHFRNTFDNTKWQFSPSKPIHICLTETVLRQRVYYIYGSIWAVNVYTILEKIKFLLSTLLMFESYMIDI